MTVPHAILIYAMYIFQIDKKKLEVNDRILIPKTTLSAMYKTNKKNRYSNDNKQEGHGP